MKSKNLKIIICMACLEILGVVFLAIGFGAFSASEQGLLPGIGRQWSMPLTVVGSLALAAGMGLALKFLLGLSKPDS